jgi:hypothetical protein
MLRPGVPAPPDGVGEIVYRPDPDGPQMTCWVCGGTGSLPRRGSECRTCGGAGRLGAVRAWRWRGEAPPPDNILGYWRSVPRDQRQATLVLTEHGGGFTNTGHAVVVAGMHGERLQSVAGRATMHGPHAVFYPFTALIVTVSHHRGAGQGQVSHLAISQTDATVTRHQLWRFEWCASRRDHIEPIELRPTPLAFPVAAAQAAISKSLTYHCRSAFYAAGIYAAGPSGALRGAGAAAGGLPSPMKGPGIGYSDD